MLPNQERLTIFKDVSFTVAPGEAVAILGRSGSGKTTLLGILGLIDTLDSGFYFVHDIETTKLTDKQAAKIRSFTFGFIYQRFCLLNHLNVYANIRHRYCINKALKVTDGKLS